MIKPKCWIIASLAVFLLLPVNILNPSFAETNKYASKNKSCESKINLPWQEFKEFLKIDKDEVALTLKELNRLLQQTDPEFKAEYRQIEGRIILSREEFKRILDHMKPLSQDKISPFKDYLLTQARYSGRMRQEDFAFTADFDLTVLKGRAYVKIPILSSSLALKSMNINEHPAIVLNEGGFYCLLIDKPGEYRVKAQFSIKSSLDRGPHKLQFPIQEVPITLVNVEIPVPDIDIQIPSAQYLETSQTAQKTSVKAILAASRSFDLQWQRKMVSEEKVPAKIYAESYQLISVEDDGLKINQDILYNILQSAVDHLKLAISDGISILSVSGPGVGDWYEIEEANQRFLLISLDYDQKGKFTITIFAEKSFSNDTMMIEYGGLKVLDTVNGMGEKGYIGIELKTSAELVLEESSGLEKVMVKKLSKHLFQKSTNPLIMGFRYLKHPYHLVLNIKKHEKVALPQATIDSASMVSFFTEEGLIINKIEYAVKNQLKQSLRLSLPEGAHIWSAIVEEESVEIGREEDTIYVPLISSRKHNNNLESFKVELIYYTESPKFNLWGMRKIALPQADLTVSQLLWSVYLPERVIYYQFSTNLEKEEMASGLTPILRRSRIKVDLPEIASYRRRGTMPESRMRDMVQSYSQKRARTTFRNIDINGNFMSKQVMNEFAFDDRLQQIEDKMIQGEAKVYTSVGVLPMNIQIPTSGQLYRFAKNIVRDEPLGINIRYLKVILFRMIAWLCFLISILVVVIWRHPFKSLILSLVNRVKQIFLTVLPPMKQFFLSRWSMPILGLVFLISLPFGGLMAAICFLLFWISVMIHLDKRIKRSKSSVRIKSIIIWLLAFSSVLFWMRVPQVYAENNKLQPEPQVSLGWEEFKEQIALDKDEIILTWDEFQKILNQTSQEIKPAFTVQNGRVKLSRAQFDKLLDQMILPRKDIPVPLDYRLTRGIYKGRMTENWTTIEAEFNLEVLGKKGYKRIPFLASQLGLQEVQVNGSPALLITEDGYHKLIIDQPGHYRIQAVFYMKSSLNEGSYQVSIPVQETSITLLELEIPLEDIKVKVPQAQQVTLSSRGASTLVSAIFPSVKKLLIQWYAKKAVSAVQKVPAKIYVQSYSLVSIDDDALKVTMDIEYNILHAGIDTLALKIPEGLNLLSVYGEGVGTWRERNLDNQRILDIKLNYEHKGIFWLTIQYEKTLLEAANQFSFSTLEALNTVKDIGYLGFELKSSAEVKVLKHEGLEKIAVQKLPQRLFQKSLKPLIFGFKYLGRPYHLVLDIRRHPKVSVTMAVIDATNAVSFFTEDGKVVHRVIYEVRNQLKQFLKIQLPEEAELWSVFVGDKPSEPATEGDTLYIPLIRSQEEGQRLKSFRVEIIYYQKDKPFSSYGKRSVVLPQVTEIMVSKILWSLYLPRDYDYLHFGGTLEKEKLVRGIGPFIGCTRAKRAHRLVAPQKEAPLEPEMGVMDEETTSTLERDKDIRALKREKLDVFSESRVSREDMMRQQVMEKGFAREPKKPVIPGRPEGKKPQGTGVIASGYDTAVMSIPISIPLSGQLYRFAKAVVRQEPLVVTMVYSQDGIIEGIGWFIFLIIIGLLFALRKRLYRLGGYAQRTSQCIESGFAKMRRLLGVSYDASLTPLILFGFMIVAVFTCHLFLASLIFLVGLCVVIHQKSYWFPKKEQKEKGGHLHKEKLPVKPAPEGETRPKERKWSKIFAWGLGIIIFIGGFFIFLISSRVGYPKYGILFFTAILIIIYYTCLIIGWLIKRIFFKKKE